MHKIILIVFFRIFIQPAGRKQSTDEILLTRSLSKELGLDKDTEKYN